MTGTPDFANPPIVELILSAQFSLLTKLSAGHFGLYWKALGTDWTEPGDGPLIEDQFELFDRPKILGKSLRLQPGRYPERFILGHQNKDRLLQIQATRFCFNWRRQEGFYPSYHRLIGEFEATFNHFSAFVDQMRIGPIVVNQWEITYIDAFPIEEYWSTPSDWPAFLPGLFGQLFVPDDLGLALEHRAAEWSYEIQPKRGRVHISAGLGRAEGDHRNSVLVTMTARGPVGKTGTESLRAGLDLGHRVIVATFLRVVSDAAKNRWRKSP